MKNEISPSLMCVEPFLIEKTLNLFQKHEINFLHIDIMDGKFVPNFGIGSDFIKDLRKNTKACFDFHLMTKNPHQAIDFLDIRKNDIVSFHYEATFKIQETSQKIKFLGAKPLIAISPTTSLSVIEEIVDYVDGINLLMVNPGFYGQKILPNCIEKAKKVKEIFKDDCIFEVDGNVSFENAKILKNFGANFFVAGSSSLFSSDDLEKNIIKLKNILQ